MPRAGRAAPEIRALGPDLQASLWRSPRPVVTVKVEGTSRTIVTDVTFQRRRVDGTWDPVAMTKLWSNNKKRCDLRVSLHGRQVLLHRAIYWLARWRAAGRLDGESLDRFERTYLADGREVHHANDRWWRNLREELSLISGTLNRQIENSSR